MATGGVVRQYAADSPSDNEEMSCGEAGTLHERLVAYVHTLAHGSRRGVWGEHSYARSRIGGRGGAGRVRVLLAPPPRAPDSPVDVLTAPPEPPAPPALSADECDEDDDDDGDDGDDGDGDGDGDDDEWEERVAALAPSPAHERLARAAADALRDARLERLARGERCARRDLARATARRLRRALAPLWLGGGGAPRWLHAALTAHMPRYARRAYEEALGELRRSAPRLAERLTGAWAPPPAPAPCAAGAAVGPESSPWLVWVASGVAALDARWERRLAALVHTRVLRGAGGARGGGAAAPERWCAGAVAAVRAALTDALAEAGSRSVILGGVGAGAAAALVLARGAGGAGGAGGVRGCVLAAPPLLTAEGARDARDDALHACRLPLLLVVGTAAADAPRGVSNNVCESGCARRLLEVRGADSELRLPRRLRISKALPQEALDAALVEECVRWAVETAEREEPSGSPPATAPERRRPALPSIVREIDLSAEEEYSHLPPASPAPSAAPVPPAPVASPSQNARNSEIVEGRVVSRCAGGTPLALAPPRRALGAADILRLPIVFADDAAAAPDAAAVTVTSGKPAAGSVKFTRVILAKRGARAAPEPRRLLLQRGVRLVPRARDAAA